MFALENFYRIVRHRSLEESRRCAQSDGTSRLWRVGERTGEKPALPGRCIFAQNDTYLELCNPGWPEQWMAFPAAVFVGIATFVILWLAYGLTVHPLIAGEIMVLWLGSFNSHPVMTWFGWLVAFPCAALISAFWQLQIYPAVVRSNFLTYLRGRIRFNRTTRKVYVLRPKFAGGDVVLEWDRALAVVNWTFYGVVFRRHERNPTQVRSLVLYFPSTDTSDPEGKGEDCIFVGPSLSIYEDPAPLWEYIRCYMEHGPGKRGIPAHIPYEFTTYCGKPSASQYELEMRPGFLETTAHMLTQMTCTWPKFPKEWQSDSGIGEPEDKPVQTGAVMTAMVYRAEGKLSAEDEVEFLTHWGTEEGLAEAKAKLAAQQGT